MIKKLLALVAITIPLGYVLIMGALSFFKPEFTYLMMPLYGVVAVFLMFWAFWGVNRLRALALIGVVLSFSFLGFFIFIISDYTWFTLSERLELLGVISAGSLLLAICILGLIHYVLPKINS